MVVCMFNKKWDEVLKDEVEKMLKHFAKQQKLEAQKKKYERVIY